MPLSCFQCHSKQEPLSDDSSSFDYEFLPKSPLAVFQCIDYLKLVMALSGMKLVCQGTDHSEGASWFLTSKPPLRFFHRQCRTYHRVKELPLVVELL